MINNSKQNCIDDLSVSLTRSSITQPRSAQVSSSLIFDLWALSCRRASSNDLPNLRLHNLNGLCGAQLLRFRKCQIASKERVQLELD